MGDDYPLIQVKICILCSRINVNICGDKASSASMEKLSFKSFRKSLYCPLFGTACDIQIDGRLGEGRPKLTWKKLTEKDCREWKLTTVDP